MKKKIMSLLLCTCVCVGLFTGCTFFGSKNEIVQEKKAVSSIIYNSLDDKTKVAYDEFYAGLIAFKEDVKVHGNLNTVEVAYDAITADHPELFYLDGYVYNEKQTLLGSVSDQISVFPKYICAQGEYNELKKSLDEKVDKIITEIPQDSDYDKAKGAFKAVTELVSYDSNANNNQNILGALEGGATCGGYAKLYAYLLQKMNIPCAMIIGTLEEYAHMWNVSLLDGNYYFSDLTNGDSYLIATDGTKLNHTDYSYFNALPNIIEQYVPDDAFSFIKFSETANNYFVKEGTYFEMYNREVIGDLLQKKSSENIESIVIAFSNIEAVQMMENDMFGSKQIQNYVSNDKNVSYTAGQRTNTITVFFM